MKTRFGKATFAHAFHAERVQRRRRLHVRNCDARHIGGERQQILAEIGSQRLRVLIIDQGLQQRVSSENAPPRWVSKDALKLRWSASGRSENA